MFLRLSRSRRVALRSFGSGKSGSGLFGFVYVVFRCFFGSPSWRKSISRSMIVLPWSLTMHLSVSVNSPITVVSTPRRAMRLMSSSSFSAGTAIVILSCDSEIHIFQGSRFGYFVGTLSSSTMHPPHSFAISAAEQESPPAPLSVIELYSSRSRASFTIASDIFFWVMGSPIWTAPAGLPSSRASDENVAPWIPSWPTRPPSTTILSPG